LVLGARSENNLLQRVHQVKELREHGDTQGLVISRIHYIEEILDLRLNLERELGPAAPSHPSQPQPASM
jgi:hypothetical protein